LAHNCGSPRQTVGHSFGNQQINVTPPSVTEASFYRVAALFLANGAALSQEVADGKINVQSACALNTLYFAMKIMKIMAHVEYKRHAPLSRSLEIKRESDSYLFLFYIICCA
jgi:hypothetical protein